MTFRTVPLNITGPSYQSRSKPLSSQKTQNWYMQADDQGKEPYVLMPFPGLLPEGNETGLDRGMYRMSEVAYQVKGEVLYKVDSDGTHTNKGTIPGTERTIIADDGINMFIVVPGDRVWQYSTDSDSITEVTNSNITGALSVDFIDNYFIYTFADFSTISNPGDGSTASGDDRIGEESDPDATVRDFVFDDVIYRCGTHTIVGWYVSGVGSPPIDRLQGRFFGVGLAARHSIASTDEAMYWLGDDHSIYRSSAGARQRISTDAISNEIRKYSQIDDAIGNTYTFQGHNFYQITFPTGNKTFCLVEKLGEKGWLELSSGVDSGAYQGYSFLRAYNKNLVADKTNGNIYELDLETYTNNDEALQRVRVTQEINGDLLGAKGQRVQMSKMKIIMETGVGVISGQGDQPRIMIEWSDDGGRTWDTGAWPEVGRLGEFTLQVEWDNLDSFYGRIIRLSTSDPVNYSVYSATIDLRLAGY